MDKIRFNRATYNLIERLVNTLEKIAVELERFNDRREEETDD